MDNTVKRIAIYVVFDKDGIIDDYITYYLDELRPNVERLVVVCNGTLTNEGRAKLIVIADDVFVRPNIGFDCGAIKDVLFNFIGWEKIYKYDELLIANDTVYGPFSPFTRVFDKMDKKDVDVWGLTIQGPTYDWTCLATVRKAIPDYLQSYFINVKSRLLKSESFRRFWKELDTDNFTFTDAILLYEHAFTARFREEGFTFDAYTDISGYFSDDPANNYTAIFFTPVDLMKKYDMPCLKKKALIFDQTAKLSFVADNGPNDVIRYVQNETNYDVNLIWDNIIRISPPDVLTNCMKLRYLFKDELDNTVINKVFDENPRLGVLRTPKPYHGHHYNTFWSDNISEYTTWIRKGLEIHGDFIELAEAAKEKGYYCGIAETLDSVAVRAFDLEFMLSRLCEYLPKADIFLGAVGAIRFESIKSFCLANKTVYLYGAGGEATRWAELMNKFSVMFEGFVVSDRQNNKRTLMEKSIYYLSEIFDTNSGFIIALNQKNTKMVLPLLKEKGFFNVLCLN